MKHAANIRPARGATPVGHLADLPAVEKGAVLYLRLWCDGPEARQAIAGDFHLLFGAERGDQLAAALTHVVCLTLGHARRPLMRHGTGCPCLGGDESAFAQMIAAAACGDRDDAVLFGMTLMSAPAVVDLMAEAEQLGLAFAEMFGPAPHHPLRGAPPAPYPLH